MTRLLVLLWGLLPALVLAQGVTSQDLRLSVEYPDLTFETVTFVYQNEGMAPVTVLSPAHGLFWLQSVQVTDAQGKALPGIVDALTAVPKERDYFTLAPHAIQRVKARAAPFSALQPATLYFLTVKQQTDVKEAFFAGTFPFGKPKPGAKFDERPSSAGLQLAVEYPSLVKPQMTLVLTNAGEMPVKVLPTPYLPLVGLYMPDGSRYPQDVTIGEPAGEVWRAVAPGATVRMPLDVAERGGIALTPGTLYFAAVHYATDNSTLTFAGLFPCGLQQSPVLR